MFEPFLVSTGVVALGEMGDKTQLLAIVLAARFRRPWPIVWGILVATLAQPCGRRRAGRLGGARRRPGHPALGDRHFLPRHGAVGC